MKAKDVLKILDVTRATLCKYVREGIIKVNKKGNGYYDYDEDSVYAFIGQKKTKHNTKIISYSRVSTQDQKNQLKEQTQRIYNSCTNRGITLDEQIEILRSKGLTINDEYKAKDLCQLLYRRRRCLV